MINPRSFWAGRRLFSIVTSTIVVLSGVWLAPGVEGPVSATVSAQAGSFVVTNTLDRGAGSLRRAISDANAHLGADTITFNIPGTGPHTIRLASNLPGLSDTTGGTTLDGYSQPGAAPNTDPRASNAKIMIQLEGQGVNRFYAVNLISSNNVVRGLAFSNFRRALYVAVSPTSGNAPVDSNRIIGTFVGINAAGVSPYTEGGVDTGAYGIYIEKGATNTVIGTAAPADRNVISGNAQDGIYIINPGTNVTRIVNNIVGLDPTGTRRVRNWGDGIDVNEGVQNTVIGGTQPGEGNVISGNQGEGVEISHFITTTRNLVMGNFIGTDLAGRNSAPEVTMNRGFGVSLEDRVTGNTVGPNNIIANNGKGGIYVSGIGTNPTPGLIPGPVGELQQAADGDRITSNSIGLDIDGAPAGNGFIDGGFGDGIWLNSNTQQAVIEGNKIAYNAGAGVRITGARSDFNRVSRNSFRSNGGLAIDIDPAGANGTSACSGDGPNQCVQAPVLTTVEPRRVVGSACASCTVELYLAARGADVAGEGEEFLLAVTADSAGRWEAALPPAAANRVLTATATDARGNTSEFSFNAPSTIYLPLVMVTRGGR
ncbi:MAG: hypothetical protein AVDCRST_MAG93-1672 [uncultured Chloroflexia bacterium]|uniref:Right handed beta helix domain-containing protein n=1 Tax=uncultured Chloroflexia bacterium TaxID=1672391 RepID=A0A6J4IF76_9CHLR|nr:MAG: hypothetical protein AVDCRST_MAG93-1672 [uncultured Chloroflexia bacterium]